MIVYDYIGDCKSTVENSVWDATQMAQLIESSQFLDVKILFNFISTDLLRRISHEPMEFECGLNKDIAWIYDRENDIHHFYRQRN